MHHAYAMSCRLGRITQPVSCHTYVARQQQTPGTTSGNRNSKHVAFATHNVDEPSQARDGYLQSAKSQQQSNSAASGAGSAHAAEQRHQKGGKNSSSFQQPLQPYQQQPEEAQDPLLANMRRPFAARQQSWQQRQQQPKQHQPQRRRQQLQQRQRAAAKVPSGTGSKQARTGMFAHCSSYQAALSAMQQQQQQQQQPAMPMLDVAGTVSLLEQLALISSASRNGCAPVVGGSSSFIEDQALQQLLPVAYDMLRQHARININTNSSSSSSSSSSTTAAAAAMHPRDVLRCVSCLASLKYSMPAQLAELLDQGPAGGKAGLSGLRIQQLASLVANLALAGVRPSNAWLVALMQEAEAKFAAANLAQLSQLLSGLVKMGVKPAALWLDAMQEQAVHCLVEQAVRVQVLTAGQLQQQWETEQQEGAASAAAAAAVASVAGDPVSSKATAKQQQKRDRSSKRRTMAGCQLHDVAQLLSALAEAKHAPKPQLAAALWGATATTLAAADTASLVELVGALGDLQLVPPVTWMCHYYSSTFSAVQSGQYKPWQLAGSVAAIGKLAKAGMTGCNSTDSGQVQQQQQDADATAAASSGGSSSNSTAISCAQWIEAALIGVHRQLGAYAARDLAALLAGLAALRLPLAASQVTAICEEVKQKLPRLNPAGLATLLAAVADLEQQQQQQLLSQQQQQQQFVLLTKGWMEGYLQEVAVKLPVFPASDLAAVLLALRASTLKPSQLWLQAATAQLHSKLTVLDPAGVVHVLDALVAMGGVPDKQWVASAVAAVESRVVELQGQELQALLQALVAVNASPSAMLLDNAQWLIQLGRQPLEQQQCPSDGVLDKHAVDACQQLLEQLVSRKGCASVSSLA